MKVTKIGIVGCGNISGIYFKICKMMENLEVVACADLVREKAEAAAQAHGIPGPHHQGAAARSQTSRSS